jgi:polysaccharide transporter, PST family
MIKAIVRIYNQIAGSIEYKNVFTNFSFLSLLQIGGYVLPLITLPYLATVLTSDGFGLIMFAQAFIQYFIVITDYGFNYSASRDIALCSEDPAKVSEIFYSVYFLKTMLLLLSLAILVITIFSFKKFDSYRMVYVITFGSVIGNVLCPTWFFLGLEKMKYITFVTLAAKLISTICVFTFVNQPEHFVRVPIINTISSVIPAFFVLTYVRKVFPITFTTPPANAIITHLKSGWYIFLSSISSSLYSFSNTFIIGILFNNAYAGYYAFAEKIIRAATSMIVPLNNAVYPFMSLKMKNAPLEAIRIFKKILILLVLLTFAGSLLIFFGSDLIRFLNPEFIPSIIILKLLSPLLLIVGVSNFIGFQVLYTNSLEKKFLISVFIAGLINLFFCFALRDLFLYKAAAISLLISEIFICVSFIFFSKTILLNKR